MYRLLGIDASFNMFFYIMVSIGFVIGIILMVAPEAFSTFIIVPQQTEK